MAATEHGGTSREEEISRMGSREGVDYNIRRAIKGKIGDLKAIGGPEVLSIHIKRYDQFPVMEVWLFDLQQALIGLVQSHCSTREQPFLFCANPVFSWARRYYEYVNGTSHDGNKRSPETEPRLKAMDQNGRHLRKKPGKSRGNS